MQKTILLLICLLLLNTKNYAQKKSVLVIDNIDSLKLKNSNDSVPDIKQPSSNFIFATSIGNTLFENRNSAIKSKTFVNNTVIYSPSVNYKNKCGLNLGVQAYYLNDGMSGIGISQYSITPGFELQENKEVEFSVSFAHYIINDAYSAYASPIQNDLYTSFMYKKLWLRPGIAIDYSAGTYRDVQRQGNFYDSTINKLKSFSFITSVSHEFNFGKVLGIADDLILTPSLMLNMGKSNTAIQHKTNTINRASVFSRKKAKLIKFENTDFQMESIGLSMDLSYMHGRFTLAPEAYLDFSIPKTDLNQLAIILNFNISYSL